MKVVSISCLVLSFVFCFLSTPSARCQGLEKLLEPGAQLVLPLDPAAPLPTISDTLRWPELPFGGEFVEGVDTGLSVFLSFWKLQLLHPRGKFYFKPGDWRVELRMPNDPKAGTPFEDFREEHVEFGNGVIGDEAGEGVNLFFPMQSGIPEWAEKAGAEVVVFNGTAKTVREGSFLVDRLGRGSLPGVRLCADRDDSRPGRHGDPRLDVIVQAEPRGPGGLSPVVNDGAVEEIVVDVPAGGVGTATFYIALVSQLATGATGIQAWVLSAALSGENLTVVDVTTAGTVSEFIDPVWRYARRTPPEIIHPDTGLPQGEGVWSAALPGIDDPPWTLPPVGTATVLKVTVATKTALPLGGVFTGKLLWRANMVGVDPVTGGRNIPLYNAATLHGNSYYFCECRGVELVFRSLPCDGESRCETVADSYDRPATDVHEAILGSLRITEAVDEHGRLVPLEVSDTDGDGDMDLLVPVSPPFSRQFATLHLDDVCGGGAPPLVTVTLYTDNAKLRGFDAAGNLVDTASSGPDYRLKVLALRSNRGIARIEIEGSQISIVEVCWCCPEDQEPQFRRGDSNTDGVVDISDASSLLSYSFLGTEPPSCLDAVDTNDDGFIDLSDAVAILNFVFLGGSPPPAPGPGLCGTDRTEDGLESCIYALCE